jgi:hypothetical protein
MTTSEPRDGINYTNALRALGRYLDAERAYLATILEVDNGFSVRFQTSLYQTDGRSAFFTWERLRDLLIYNTAGRGLRGRRQWPGMWPGVAGGRQDLYRALGTKLDAEEAAGVTVDEQTGQIDVSFVRRHPDRPMATEKLHENFPEGEFGNLIAWAQTQRDEQLAASGQ